MTCVKLTYKLIGESEQTTTLFIVGEQGGKPVYFDGGTFGVLWDEGEWLVFYMDSGMGPIGTTPISDDYPLGTVTFIENVDIFEYVSISACNTIYYLSTCNPADQGISFYTEQDLNVGEAVTIEGYDQCLNVQLATQIENEIPELATLNYTEHYQNCEQCTQPFFLLEDCQERFQPLYSSDERLLQHVGDFIRIPYFQDSCFSVTRVPFKFGVEVHQYIDFTNAYNSCDSCYGLDYIEPNTEVCGCDPEKITEVSCLFVDMVYQEMMSKRLGIDFCCPIEKEKTIISFKNIENKLLCTNTPELPEPEIIECCINFGSTCCNPCNQQLSEDCNCESSGDNSPHDCHNYMVTVTDEMIAEAIGNTDIVKNNTVVFTYFPCKKENPTTKTIKTPGEYNFCVLGKPLFGYYNDNIFVELDTTRGTICEPEINSCI